MIAKRLYISLKSYICQTIYNHVVTIVPCAPPENVTTTEVSGTSVHLNWIPPLTEHHAS